MMWYYDNMFVICVFDFDISVYVNDLLMICLVSMWFFYFDNIV